MKMKRLLALFLVGCMVCGIAGCGKGSDDKDGKSNVSAEVPDYINMDSQMPIVKEGTDITLEIMIVNGPLYSNLDSIKDVYFTQAYEERTGVKIEWTEVSSDAFADQLALCLAKGDLPDIILKGGVSNSSQLKYGEQGYFLNLMENNMLENYAPNYSALCKEYPEILSASMQPDGTLYSLGMVRNSTGSTLASKLFFNKEWLNKVGLNTPTTSEEFYNVLKAFKENDPNGNGRADEIGLYVKPEHLEYTTFGMFGLGNRGRNNVYIDWDQKAKAVRYFPATDEFREWVEWISKMYKEGLINKQYFDFTESALGNNINNNTCGVFAYTNLSMIGEETQKKFTYLGDAMTGPAGAKDYYGVNSIGSTGSFIITTACEYPEVALRWADYFYSEEGSLFFYFGDEGVTFDKLDDGTYRYSEQVLADYYSGVDSFDGCATRVSLYGYGHTPTMTKVPFNAADDNKGIALEAANALIEDCANAWPEFTFTTQEQRIIEDNKGDIDLYVHSMRDAWIMGTQELNDDTWNQFLDTLKNMGVQDVLEVYESALERIYDNGFKEGYHTLKKFE